MDTPSNRAQLVQLGPHLGDDAAEIPTAGSGVLASALRVRHTRIGQRATDRVVPDVYLAPVTLHFLLEK